MTPSCFFAPTTPLPVRNILDCNIFAKFKQTQKSKPLLASFQNTSVNAQRAEAEPPLVLLSISHYVALRVQCGSAERCGCGCVVRQCGAGEQCEIPIALLSLCVALDHHALTAPKRSTVVRRAERCSREIRQCVASVKEGDPFASNIFGSLGDAAFVFVRFTVVKRTKIYFLVCGSETKKAAASPVSIFSLCTLSFPFSALL